MKLSDSDIQRIRESTDAFVAHSLSQNFDAVADLYTDNAVVMPPGRPAVSGRTNIKNLFETFGRFSRFDVELDEIEGREDLGYARGRVLMIFTPPGASGPVEYRGKYVEVRRRQADGSWLMAVDIFNSDAG